jgi:spermidine/putrescine transport system ATP-binding protein
MNIYENIAFGLRIKKLGEASIRQKVGWALELVNLPGIEKRMPESLSGGQQQRIAIARAIVNEPSVLLLDEPLGALDLKLRQEMQMELKKLQQSLGIAFIYVTHDQEEALTMSDTIVVMSRGSIQQIGMPTDIYNEPKNTFVARFIGESNIEEGVMIRDRLVSFLGKQFPCVDEGFALDEPVNVVIRPEDVHLSAPSENDLRATVESVVFKGVHYEMVINVQGHSWLVHSTAAQPIGTQVSVSIRPFDIHVMKQDLEEDLSFDQLAVSEPGEAG